MNDDTIHPAKKDVKNSGRYVSVLREEQARNTRQKVIDAAHDLFVQDGYVSTSIAAVANKAGVSPQAIYVIFGTKRDRLSAVTNMAIGGDAQPIGVLERTAPQQMREQKDPRVQLRMMAHGICEILDRAGPLFDVMRVAGASDPDIATSYQNLQEPRRQNMGWVIGWGSANGLLKGELTDEEAADILWTLTSADVHRMLRIERNWATERYEAWLAESLIAALLPSPPTSNGA